MFCENCGNKNQTGHRYCIKCGYLVDSREENTSVITHKPLIINEKWWFRLLKVLYILLYLPLLIIIPLVWDSNAESCYYSSCSGSDSEAFWYSILTLIICIAVIRLIKVTVIYVVIGRSPEWKKEFNKLY